MHGTIEITKPRKWTARDEYYLRAAIENAAFHRDMLDRSMSGTGMRSNQIAITQRHDLIRRADENLAALLARKEAAKEAI